MEDPAPHLNKSKAGNLQKLLKDTLYLSQRNVQQLQITLLSLFSFFSSRRRVLELLLKNKVTDGLTLPSTW